MNGPKREELITYRLDFLFPFQRSLLHNTHDDTTYIYITRIRARKALNYDSRRDVN